MARKVSPRLSAVQRALVALATAGVALGAAASVAHAGVRAPAGPASGLRAAPVAVPADGDIGVVNDIGEVTGPLAQVWSIGAVPAVGSVGGLFGGGQA
ncbi:hypothetical protein [Streptomyces sp. NPDC006739]|uniref:hypothetical protein n=1 Tax=Streptomyces sp. NPDC006739 TaxID=3364763 RepID=UPI0036C2B5F8